ncbi:MAG: nuclear transport factor 2 family protein [Acidobacteriales bacterium]|nr:nuclear transport factor 2 family protein [Terriglobales bacterium]
MSKLVWLVTSLLAFATVAAPRSKSKRPADSDVASTIIAMERAALNRSDKGDADGFLEISDPGVVYFDPSLEEPIYGLEALRAYYHKGFGSEQASGEMIHPKVQVMGDVAVLTFNYISKRQPSQRITRWNTTEVYRRTRDGWRIIHTHWSFLKPSLVQPQ